MWVHLAASFESLQQLSEDSGAGKYAVLGEALLEIFFNQIVPHCFILKMLKDSAVNVCLQVFCFLWWPFFMSDYGRLDIY